VPGGPAPGGKHPPAETGRSQEDPAIARIVHPNDRHLYGKQVRLIDEANQPVGIVLFADAMQRAQAAGLDLVEIAANAAPPVCRIMDYGKFQYAEAKKQKQARKGQVQVKLKELKFHPNINENDYQVKLGHAVDFLKKGCKVKALMYFRGREMAHVDLGMKVMERLVADVAEHGSPESPLRRIGPSIATVISASSRKQG
jgi:translation initiation factor IF-3